MGSPFAPNEVPAPVCAAALTESQYHVRSAYEIFKVQSSPEKKNTAHAVQAKDFVGWNGGKTIGCVAGRYVLSGQSSAESGGYHGENHHFCQQDLE